MRQRTDCFIGEIILISKTKTAPDANFPFKSGQFTPDVVLLLEIWTPDSSFTSSFILSLVAVLLYTLTCG